MTNSMLGEIGFLAFDTKIRQPPTAFPFLLGVMPLRLGRPRLTTDYGDRRSVQSANTPNHTRIDM